jgi:hypothetical protein
LYFKLAEILLQEKSVILWEEGGAEGGGFHTFSQGLYQPGMDSGQFTPVLRNGSNLNFHFDTLKLEFGYKLTDLWPDVAENGKPVSGNKSRHMSVYVTTSGRNRTFINTFRS